ncbi:FtsK/SpoIIIE family DNA translocase [Mucisphaera calidilacus]|uniref:DNA translocase FtsK n=1 Tax=Mucisphaera calidilacus TaxID=2527982 RepID=A0A518BTR0_9BACT|nr:DNA translocase FtsK [Mucisphaera calidilacus]QDU70363.1 DNA translocase FtsK [Mucisphaera calidilacus]
MPAKRKTQADENTRALPWLIILWLIGAGLWLLLVVSLLSYNPMDPPAVAEGVTNTEIANWAGSVGAYLAHKAYLMLGPGVWILAAGAGVYLALRALGHAVPQLWIRTAGLLLMAVTGSALLAAALPAGVTGHASAPGTGGLLAAVIELELSERFALIGTLLILGLTFWVGAILTEEKLAIEWPMRLIGLGWRGARAGVPMAAGAIGALGEMARPRPGGSRLDRMREASRERATASRKKRQAEEDEHIDEDAGGFGGTEAFDPDEHVVAEEEDEYEYEEVDEDEEPEEEDDEELDDEAEVAEAYLQSQKKFNPDELRAKMAALPINFAPKQAKSTAPPREIDLSGYQFPGMDFLEEPEGDFTAEQEAIVRDQALELEKALRQYRIEGEVVGIDSGPVITLFEVRLAPGTKVSRIQAVDSDLARAMKAQNIRVVANSAGKDTVGIEVPNIKKERVRLKELMQGSEEATRKMRLPMFLGKDASGTRLISDLASMPHLLIAGTTGSGKSVCMNAVIMSFLYTKRPDELKLVLVDPKMVEMSMFRDIPHLMCPVVTEMPKAASILEWAVTKMDERYELLAEVGVRDISSYNELEWEEILERMEPSSPAEEARIPKKLPYIVFVIDELADLMMTNKEVEGSIVRIAQKARAVGIHLILATQRPQANVVTGLIKSNMPARIAFKVASGMDSRIVLDQKGGELLLGHGDMLFLSPRSSKLTRAQGSLVEDSEVRGACRFLKTQAEQNFEPQLVQLRSEEVDADLSERDPLFDEAVRVVIETNRGSVSLLQRRMNIGYGRASRIIEEMEAAGILGGHKTAQAREVNISLEEWEAMTAQAAADAALEAGASEEGEEGVQAAFDYAEEQDGDDAEVVAEVVDEVEYEEVDEEPASEEGYWEEDGSEDADEDDIEEDEAWSEDGEEGLAEDDADEGRLPPDRS